MKLPTGRTALSVVTRLLLACVLLLALASPPLPGARRALDVTLLVDDSLSMPRDFIDRSWGETLALHEALPAQSTLRLLRFGADVVAEPFDRLAPTLPRRLALDGSATNIARALRSALQQLPGNRPGAVLLVSDAAATLGDTDAALQQLRDAGIPVYLMTPAASAGAAGPRLVDVQVPARIKLGDALVLRAQLRGVASSELPLTLLVNGVVRERRRLSLPASGSLTTDFGVQLAQPGIAELTVRIETDPGTARQPGLQLTRAVTVLGQAPVLYMASPQVQGGLVGRLRTAGLDVTVMAPAQLLSRRAALQRAGAIVLDDVAAGAMSDSAWDALAEAVRERGSGLLVLGGAHSFGAGAYRHSRLEQLLPVTAEAALPQEQAAVLFLLDKSGSMGRSQGQPGRFALGRQAVAATAQQLLPGDLLGITAFAADVDIRLPVAPGHPGGEVIARALRLTPSGGTRLGPALWSAAQQLRELAVAQRLLVLVTDGFAGEEDLQPVARALQQAGVTVIALAVGNAPQLSTLRQLTRFNGGRILPVADVATLPRLMSAEVATRRAPRAAPSTAVIAQRQPPFMTPAVSAWPALAGYMVSKLRDGADLHLRSDRGDPLLAAGFAGAGRVAVMPGGLGAWAASWWHWPRFDEFLVGTLQWLGRGQGDGRLWLDIDEQDGRVLFSVDQPVAGQWGPPAPRLVLREPGGAISELPVQLQAPGRYQASYAATRTGRYVATVHGLSQTLQQGFYRNASREFVDPGEVARQQQEWLQRGLLQRWPGSESFTRQLPRATAASRRPLLALAALGYLCLLLWERGLLPRPGQKR